MSKNGVWVRLPAERWQHISEEHPELAHFRTAVLEAIANAEYVLEGNAGEFLAVRPLDSSRVLVVAYREVDRHDGLQAEAAGMALVQLSDFLDVIPAVLQSPHRAMHCTYDELADVIYVNFEPGAEATDSEFGADDVIVRYRGDEVIGLTILHASRRSRVNGK